MFTSVIRTHLGRIPDINLSSNANECLCERGKLALSRASFAKTPVHPDRCRRIRAGSRCWLEYLVPAAAQRVLPDAV